VGVDIPGTHAQQQQRLAIRFAELLQLSNLRWLEARAGDQLSH